MATSGRLPSPHARRVLRGVLASLLAAAAPAAAAPPAMELEGLYGRGGFQILLSGEAELPHGAVINVRCALLAGGKKVPGSEKLHVMEVRHGRFESAWTFPRETFKPGTYVFEATLQESQPASVAAVLTDRHRAFRIVRQFVKKGERSPAEAALEICRPLVKGLRAAAAAAPEMRGIVDAALDGRLAAADWTAFARRIEPDVAALEKTLARRDLPYYLPGAVSVREAVARMRAAMDACEGVARGTLAPEKRSALTPVAFPQEADATALLRPVLIDVLELCVAAAADVARQYPLIVDSSNRSIKPLTPEQQSFVKEQVHVFSWAWPAIKELHWGGLPESAVDAMDAVLKDLCALPDAKKGGSGKAEPIVTRLLESVDRVRSAVVALRTDR